MVEKQKTKIQIHGPVKKHPNKQGWKYNLNIFIQCAVLVIILRTFVIQPFFIPSGSMNPTLRTGDFILTTKYDYGFSRYSVLFGNYWLPNFDRIFSSGPKRGDVVVFRLISENLDYIKRVIGLPGDTVQVKNGRLYINDTIVERKRLEDTIVEGKRIPTYMETLPNGVKHKIWEVYGDDSLLSDNTPKYTIPEGYYFMMGDNRDQSQDSRFSAVGFVSIKQLVAHARFITFSVQKVKLWPIWKWYSVIRGSRIGKVID